MILAIFIQFSLKIPSVLVAAPKSGKILAIIRQE
jgi:hypothetical protein